jgi:outer membrane biosynthesis protein TonB
MDFDKAPDKTRDQRQDTSQSLIPCIYCNHSNPPSHRFCGMCSKALPDLVKRSARLAEGTSGAPIPGSGLGVAGRAPGQGAVQPSGPAPVLRGSAASTGAGTSTPRPPAANGPPTRIETRGHDSGRKDSARDDPNRDLSYLLQDDHIPARASRVPFVVGGLLLAAVVAFFAMRSGSPKPPAPADSAAGDTVSTPVEAPAKDSAQSKAPDARPSASQPMEPEKVASENGGPPHEPATAQPAGAETITGDPAAKTPSPKRAPSVVSKPVPKTVPKAAPVRASAAKPSPARQRAEVAVDTQTAESSVAAASSDCEKQLPSLRRAAGRGDAKARADLGLIYYAGRCVPRDLPTAYRWYALALRTAPENSQVSAQLEAIWKQMSPAERQLALKSQ